MRQAVWGQRPPSTPEQQLLGQRAPVGLADPATIRRRLRGLLTGTDSQCVIDDGIDQVLLTMEELASNALRHGRPPVRLRLLALSDGWLIDVTDTAPQRPPVPAVNRDPDRGWLRLHLVADLCPARGWTAHPGHKHVSAWLRPGPP